MNTEELLTGLFDFQRFARSPDLQSILDEAEARYGFEEMSEEELLQIAAAGDPFTRGYGEREEDRIT